MFSSLANQWLFNALISQKIWYSNGVRSGLYAGWGRSWNFSFYIISVVTAAVWGPARPWCKTTLFISIPVCLLWIEGFISFVHSTIPCTIDHVSAVLVMFEEGPFKIPKNSVNITLPAEGTLLNFLVQGSDLCFTPCTFPHWLICSHL